MDFDKIDPMVKVQDQTSSTTPTSAMTSFQQQQQQQQQLDERDPNYLINALRHQDVSPTSITNFLIKLCDTKSPCIDDLLAKFATQVVERLICESPLTEILHILDSKEFHKKIYSNHQHFDYDKFLKFCRYLCSSDKQGYDILGTAFFAKVWQHNSHFQYEFIKFCILSDMVQFLLNNCILSNLTKKVPQIEILKCPPEYDTDHQIYCWKYQCLSQILLDLSENQAIYPYLEEIFFLPLNKCPDLLVFALLECHGSQHLKEVVLAKALLKFICVSPNNPNPNPNATLIIQKIWPSDYVYTAKNLSLPQKSLLTSMVELYTSSSLEEQSYKLSKILDLSQDLKVLNLLLSSNTYSFVIDLACFASRREYLKLDKWLNDKIKQIGQQFIDACLQFLKRRCHIFGASEPSSMSLPNETFRTILTCLRSFVPESPTTVSEFEIVKMFNKFNQWINQQQNQFVTNNNNNNNQQQLPMNMSAVNSVNANQFDGSVVSQQQQQQQQSQQFSSNDNNSIRNLPLNSQNQLYFPEVEQEFSRDIEEEADLYFQRIYNQDQPDALTIDQFLDMLKRFQESNVQREKDIAMCIIRNLFKEYPFLSQYPDKELVITGEIFGGIIMNNFVKGVSIYQALRCVSDALKRPLATRYFTFGQAALNKMKNRFKDFPQFCQHLCNISVYRDLPPNLIEYIEYGKQSMDPPSIQAKRISNFKMISNNNNGSVTNNSAPADAPFQQQINEFQPPNAFQDKVAFIINNLSQINLNKKAEEFKELFLKELFLKDQYLLWFSHYFVMKRVSLEANFHELYATFMVKVSLYDLSTKVLWETYRNIQILLRAIKDQDIPNDRTLLKNLGQWLGLITLAQHKPILSRNLDLRNLLIEAYHKGLNQLNYVVPFIAKVLSGSAKSKIFRPPNPWTVKLIKILVELHSEQDLKLTLKFEVERLCQELNIILSDYVGKSQELKNKEYFAKLESQLGSNNNNNTANSNNSLSLNFVANMHSTVVEPQPASGIVTAQVGGGGGGVNIPMSMHHHQSPPSSTATASFDVNSVHVAQRQQQQQQQQQVSNAIGTNLSGYSEIQMNNQPNLAIVIQPNLQMIMINPQHKNIIKSVIEKCVQEWINFISERVIKICLVATETLVKKDFAQEVNADMMRDAAHKMMRCLVAGYSLINSEEPLFARIKVSLENYFQPKQVVPNVNKELIDSTISTLINDNIELCVCFVQKTCMERAVEELDKRMKPDFEARQNAMAKVADGKKPLPSTVTLKQMQIYEEMGRNIAGFTSSNNTSGSFYSQMENTANNNNNSSKNNPNFGSHPIVMAASAANNHNYPSMVNQSQNNEPSNAINSATNPQPFVDHFVVIYDKLIKHLTELIIEFEHVHYTTEAMHQVLETLKHCKQNPRDQTLAVTLIKNVINGLRELIINSEAGVTDFAVITRARDFYLLLLKALTDQRAYNLRFTTTTITRVLIDQWIQLNQVFPDELFDPLYRTDLINFACMDSEFHNFLENQPNTLSLNLIMSFLKCYLPTIPASNFVSTLELLQRITMKMNQTNHPLVNDLKNILSLARLNLTNNMEMVDNAAAIVEKFDAIIKEWISCYNSSKNLQSSFSIVVKNMNTHGLLKNDDLISRFFKSFLESCVERCYQIIAFAAQHPNVSIVDIHIKCYEYIDAFSVLVLLFIKQSGNQGNVDQKFQFLSRILHILASTAHKDQEVHQKDFFSLTYYRILLYIFIEFFYSPNNLGIQDMLIRNDNLFEVFKWHLVKNYCNVLHTISPLKTPSFTLAWLDFISHRVFIGKCLDNSLQINYKTWHVYYSLLSDLLMFQKPFLQNVESFMLNTNQELYKGTLKLFLLLFHDFPEFLCEYCYNLCDLIPIRAVQLRNIILSAHPTNIQDVSSVKVDNLHEIVPQPRRINSLICEQLFFQKELDNYLSQRVPISFLTALSDYLVSPPHQPQHFNNYDKPPSSANELNTSMINALTLYLGLSAIQTNKTLTINSISNSAHMDVFQNLLHSLDSQGRYILINSILDHLRYPNTETLFFICLILALFKDNDEHVREQIIRVLLERIIALHPHPWGITYVINELIRNPNYKLLEHNFIKCIPEIEKYFSHAA